jgi:hypothetical protein
MRRARFDPLEPTEEPHWYTVRNMYGKLLEARLLPPGRDLKRAFVAALNGSTPAGSSASFPRPAASSSAHARVSGARSTSPRAIRGELNQRCDRLAPVGVLPLCEGVER